MSSTRSPQEQHFDVRPLSVSDLGLLTEIDRSEHVEYAYELHAGSLIRIDVDWHVPPWDLVGDSGHSVEAKVNWLRAILQRGAAMYGALDGDRLAGIVVIEPNFDGTMAWLAFLHVSHPYRGQGVGRMLWDQAMKVVRLSGATVVYVSSTPSGPTVDFYLARGCRLADPPHQALFAMEPDDIHLIAVVPAR